MEYSEMIGDYFAQFVGDNTFAVQAAHRNYEIYRNNGGESPIDDWFFSNLNTCIEIESMEEASERLYRT